MSTPSGRIAIAAVSVVAALAVGWTLPLAAMFVLWPLLMVVPGWAIVRALRPHIDGAGRLGLGIVGSVAVSTHLVYWLSHLAGGYGRGVIFAAAAVLAVPLLAAAWRGTLPRGRRAFAMARGALAVAGLAGLIVGATLWIGLWRVTPTGVVSGGSNWSDLGVHLSIAETLNAGANFPPEVPYFAGEPLVYHWFADFHAAILAEAASVFSVPAMVVQSAVLAAALALLVYSLARRLVRGDQRRRVATIAAGLAVFAGGLGYVRLIGDIGAGLGDPLELVARNSYDNQWLTEWPYFRIPSVMGTGLLAHRATTAGLPMLIGTLLLLVAGVPTARARAAGWRDRPALIAAAGVVGGLLAPFHFFFLPAAALLVLAWVLFGGRLLDRHAWRNAPLFLVPYVVLAAPFAIVPALQASGSGSFGPVMGWRSAPIADGLAAVGFFYATNLGVPFLLAAIALLRPRLPHRGFIAAWVIGLFLVPNLVQVSVVDFDMNKYFQAMWIGVAIAAAWLIRRWPLPAVATVLALSVPSPLLVAAWTATSDLQVLSRAELAATRWVADHTPADAVFVTDGWVNSATDAAGRKRLTTFGPYIANLGFDPDDRIADVSTIYCGGDAGLSADLMRRYGATHVLDGGRPQPCAAPVEFGASDRFELVYDAGPLVWELVDR